MARGVKPLYTSGEVRSAITALFSFPQCRRVAVAAFVGEGAGAFLPYPKGIELICWPQAGGTSPAAVRDLMACGVRVKFADRLHMKVYWAEGRGVVVTSANLSVNALGAGNLREAGILLPAGAVDIDRIVAAVRPRRVTEVELSRLDKAHKRFYTGKTRVADRSRTTSFSEWYSRPPRSKWKLGCWDSEGPVAKSAKHASLERFGVRYPHDFIGCTQRQYSPDDWILCFRGGHQSVSHIKWMYVDFIVKVARSDKGAYCSRYPYQAVQVRTAKHYPTPPFAASADFKRAFKTAVTTFGLCKVIDRDVTMPPRALVELIHGGLES